MDQAALDARFAFASDLVEEAGRLALEFFRRLDTLTVRSKGLQDLVSEADVETEILIRSRLKERFPEDGFLGEETGRAELSGAGGVWVVDPIDGTQPFVRGMSGWCVSIAFVADGRLEMGFVNAPARAELFIGRRGGAATLNGRPIHVSGASSIADGILAIGYSTRRPPDRFLEVFASLIRDGAMFHREGSGALSLCYVAAGRLVGYIEIHINSWDCLGAVAVIQAAGGKVNDFLAGDGLWSGNPLAAGTPGVYPRLAAALDA